MSSYENSTMDSNSKKALERLLFVADIVPNINILNLRASVYFADLLSVRRIGRMIAEDSYLPLLNGPMPLSLFSGLRDGSINTCLEVINSTITGKKKPRTELFSKSDLRFLETTSNNYGKMDIRRVRLEFTSDKTLAIFGRSLDNEIGLRQIVESLDRNGDLATYVNGK